VEEELAMSDFGEGFNYRRDSVDYLRDLRDISFEADDPEIEDLLESADEMYVEHLLAFDEDEKEFYFDNFERYMESVGVVLQLNKTGHLDYEEWLGE